MRWWSELKYVVKKLNRRRAERELQEEIDAHLEMETREKIAVFAPIPSPSVSTATKVKPGFFLNIRAP